MKYSRNLGIAVFFIATVMLLSTSLFLTSLSISDADPSTYVIVPILMIPLFVLFSAKTHPDPHVEKRDIAIGSLMFAAFIVLVFFSRFYFSFFFASFRIDLLLLPLAIASIAVLLFGTKDIGKFKGVLLYALFASPPVLFFVMNSYGAFTSLNTVIVYGLLKTVMSGAQYVAPITIIANGYYIGIGQECVSIGIFMALALFLVPIAYLYKGRDSSKVAWVASGIALLFVLNVARMLFVSYEWLAYGPSSVVAQIHAYAGGVLFMLSIVAMVLVAGRYGLSLAPNIRVRKIRKHASKESLGRWSLAIALAFSLVYLCATLGYANALNVPPIPLANEAALNVSNPGIAHSLTETLQSSGYYYLAMVGQNGTYAIVDMTNDTISLSSPITVIVADPSEPVIKDVEGNGTIRSAFEFLNRNGIQEEVSDILSNGTESFVYRTEMPFVMANMSSSIAGIYVIIPGNVVRDSGCAASYDGAYAFALNSFDAGRYNQTEWGDSLKALCISDKIVWSQ
jgi:exosortase/archaeosortase family protein